MMGGVCCGVDVVMCVGGEGLTSLDFKSSDQVPFSAGAEGLGMRGTLPFEQCGKPLTPSPSPRRRGEGSQDLNVVVVMLIY